MSFLLQNRVGGRAVDVGLEEHVLVLKKSDFSRKESNSPVVGFTDFNLSIIQGTVQTDFIIHVIISVQFWLSDNWESMGVSIVSCCDEITLK